MKKQKAVEKAGQITDEVLEEVLPRLSAGLSEKEIVRALVGLFRKKQASLAFPPIVAFGKNSAQVHHLKPTSRKPKRGDVILIDLGAKHQGHCADLSRTFFFGKVSAEQRRLYNLVLRAQEETIKKIKPGMRAGAADKIARDIILKAGYGQNFKHALGHGLGRTVHQKGFRLGPRSRRLLGVGDIFTLEPGIYIEGWGGIRLEDTVVLTASGVRSLTRFSKKLKVLPTRPAKPPSSSL